MKAAPTLAGKVCKTCGESKPLSEYTRFTDRSGRSHVRGECKPCRSRAARAQRAAVHLRIKVITWTKDYERKCRECGKWKPSGEFHRFTKDNPLWSMPCKACRNATLRRGPALRTVAVSDARWTRCSRCAAWKPASDFYRSRAGAVRRDARCKDCNHAEKTARDREHRTALRAAAMEAAGGPWCVVCGEDDPIVLHFHHTDPAEKTASVSRLIRHGTNPGPAIAEARKCVLLCANDHLRVHYGALPCPTPSSRG